MVMLLQTAAAGCLGLNPAARAGCSGVGASLDWPREAS